MKKKFWKFGLVLAALMALVMLGTLATAAETEGYYTYTVTDGEATITDVDTAISGDIEIPETLGGYPVTSIGDYAFSRCSSLTSITIPNSVISIGVGIFDGCSDLVNIKVVSGNEVYHSSENCLIETYYKILVAGCKNSVIPTDGSVTSIGDSAFANCIYLRDVSIPDSISHIGRYAYVGCNDLSKIFFGENSQLTVIDDGAFSFCESLTNFNLPQSVTRIHQDVFLGCESLTYNIYDNAKYLGNTNSPYFALIEPVSDLIISCTIHDQTVIIAESAFYGCSELISISIPQQITRLDWSVFSGCTSLKDITIPKSVTSIGWLALNNCSALRSLVFLSPTTQIFDSADTISNTATIYAGGAAPPPGPSGRGRG